MPVTGLYLARRIRQFALPYVSTYGHCVMEDVLPAFANLSQRADKVEEDEYSRLISQPAPEDCDGDLSGLAEDAHEKGQAFYDTMMALRQTTLNLYAAGLFHLVEQQLSELCRDGAFVAPPPNDTKLSVVAAWYREHFGLDLASLLSWPSIEQLRLIANSVKHGEGSSAAQLRTLCPKLFHHPTLVKLHPDWDDVYASRRLALPLAGEDLYITEEVFWELSAAAACFVAEIADYFAAHAEEQYDVGG